MTSFLALCVLLGVLCAFARNCGSSKGAQNGKQDVRNHSGQSAGASRFTDFRVVYCSVGEFGMM
jgi:hypothetical protein